MRCASPNAASILLSLCLSVALASCVGSDPGGIAPLPSPADESLGGVDGPGVSEPNPLPEETSGSGGGSDEGGKAPPEVGGSGEPDVRAFGEDAAVSDVLEDGGSGSMSDETEGSSADEE